MKRCSCKLADWEQVVWMITAVIAVVLVAIILGSLGQPAA